MSRKNGSMSGIQHASTIIINIPMIFGSLGVQQSNSLISLELGVLTFQPIQSLNDSIIKAREYGMILYFIKIPDPKFSFCSKLTKFQQCMFRRIYWILTSLDILTKIPFSRCLNLEVHGALIEYKNEKAKLAHYLIQIIDSNDPCDQ